MGTPPKISSWTFSALSEVKLRRGARRRRRRRRRISGGEDFILDVFSPERKKVAARRAAEAAAAALALGMDADGGTVTATSVVKYKMFTQTHHLQPT